MFYDIFVDRSIEQAELVSIFIIESSLFVHFEIIILWNFQIFTTLCKYSERGYEKKKCEIFYFHKKIEKILRRSDFFCFGISSLFFLSQNAPAIIVHNTTLVISTSIFFILSFDFLGNIILFFDVFYVFYFYSSCIDYEVGDSDYEHTAFYGRTDSIES